MNKSIQNRDSNAADFILTKILNLYLYGNMVKKIIQLSVVLLLLGGCSYSVRSNAFPYLKGVQLIAWENKSSEFSLGNTVYNRLSKDLQEDGRLRLVTQQADCLLEGVITDYKEKIYSFDDANNVQEYEVSISCSITFTDLKNNVVLYENKSLRVSEIYSEIKPTTVRFQSKGEAIDECCDKIFRTIMQNTLEKW